MIQRLYSEIKIGSDTVAIHPLTLFLRLVLVVDKKTEDKIAEYFKYELPPYPMSFFKGKANSLIAPSCTNN